MLTVFIIINKINKTYVVGLGFRNLCYDWLGVRPYEPETTL